MQRFTVINIAKLFKKKQTKNLMSYTVITQHSYFSATTWRILKSVEMNQCTSDNKQLHSKSASTDITVFIIIKLWCLKCKMINKFC